MYMLTVMQSDLTRCTYECLKKNPSVAEALSLDQTGPAMGRWALVIQNRGAATKYKRMKNAVHN